MHNQLCIRHLTCFSIFPELNSLLERPCQPPLVRTGDVAMLVTEGAAIMLAVEENCIAVKSLRSRLLLQRGHKSDSVLIVSCAFRSEVEMAMNVLKIQIQLSFIFQFLWHICAAAFFRILVMAGIALVELDPLVSADKSSPGGPRLQF